MVVRGPFERVDVGGGRSADLWLLRYGDDGRLVSTLTQDDLVASLAGCTDVFLFAHGWNNTPDDAAASYRRFISGYAAQGSGPGVLDQPVLVGVVWPSTSFTMPWEDGPVIAGDGGGPADLATAVREGAGRSLPRPEAERLDDLLSREGVLPAALAEEAARLALRLLPAADPEDGTASPAPDEVLAAWAALDGRAAPPPADPDDFGEPAAVPPGGHPAPGDAAGGAAGGRAGPRPAGILGGFDPRTLARMASVWMMKDRAGKVGARGVAPLVGRILGDGDARLHLVGHSFGCRLLLSAVAAGELPRRVRSMLLLQPAVNRWCFADDVVGTGRAGGYRPVLRRVEQPVLSTRSSHDVPLRQAFHLAVRGRSLGEPRIAAIGDTDRYGALGGYGPAGLGDAVTTQAARPPGVPYRLDVPHRVVVVDGGGQIGGRPAIGGHGDVNTPVTWWALRCLVHGADGADGDG